MVDSNYYIDLNNTNIFWDDFTDSTNVSIIIDYDENHNYDTTIGGIPFKNLWNGNILSYKSTLNPLVVILNMVGHSWGIKNTLTTLTKENDFDIANLLLRVINFNNKVIKKVLENLNQMLMIVLELGRISLKYYSAYNCWIPNDYSIKSSIRKTSPPTTPLN